MKIPELRKQVQNLSVKDMETIIVEMYKMMPKKFIEEKKIDELVKNCKAFTQGKKSSKKATEQPDFISLKIEIEQFIEHANDQYYLAPNRVVQKKDRPKWRFAVKRDPRGISSRS